MPFKSEAQRRKFYAMAARGEISEETLKEWQDSTGDKELPEKVGKEKTALNERLLARAFGKELERHGLKAGEVLDELIHNYGKVEIPKRLRKGIVGFAIKTSPDVRAGLDPLAGYFKATRMVTRLPLDHPARNVDAARKRFVDMAEKRYWERAAAEAKRGRETMLSGRHQGAGAAVPKVPSTVSEEGAVLGGTTYNPDAIGYKGSRALSTLGGSGPGERWITAHPDVAAGYARRPSRFAAEARISAHDLSRAKDWTGGWTPHIARPLAEGEVGAQSPEALKALLGEAEAGILRRKGNFWGRSPTYEGVATADDLARSLLAEYKQLPGGGYMRVRGAPVLGEWSAAAPQVKVSHVKEAKQVRLGPPPKRNRKQWPYQGTINFRGLDILVENKRGTDRVWTDENSNETGRTRMHHHYGEVRRTMGPDGDPVDVFVGPDAGSDVVYIVHQMKRPKYKEYDEDKCMLGFRTAKEAKAAYLKHYDNPKFFGSMTTMSFDDFAKLLRRRDVRGKRITEALIKVGAQLFFPSVKTASTVRELFREEMSKTGAAQGEEKLASSEYVVPERQFRPGGLVGDFAAGMDPTGTWTTGLSKRTESRYPTGGAKARHAAGYGAAVTGGLVGGGVLLPGTVSGILGAARGVAQTGGGAGQRALGAARGFTKGFAAPFKGLARGARLHRWMRGVHKGGQPMHVPERMVRDVADTAKGVTFGSLFRGKGGAPNNLLHDVGSKMRAGGEYSLDDIASFLHSKGYGPEQITSYMKQRGMSPEHIGHAMERVKGLSPEQTGAWLRQKGVSEEVVSNYLTSRGLAPSFVTDALTARGVTPANAQKVWGELQKVTNPQQAAKMLEAHGLTPEQAAQILRQRGATLEGVGQHMSAKGLDVAAQTRRLEQFGVTPERAGKVFQAMEGATPERAAQILRDSGVSPENIVKVLAERGVGQRAATFAVERLGVSRDAASRLFANIHKITPEAAAKRLQQEIGNQKLTRGQIEDFIRRQVVTPEKARYILPITAAEMTGGLASLGVGAGVGTLGAAAQYRKGVSLEREFRGRLRKDREKRGSGEFVLDFSPENAPTTGPILETQLDKLGAEQVGLEKTALNERLLVRVLGRELERHGITARRALAEYNYGFGKQDLPVALARQIDELAGAVKPHTPSRWRQGVAPSRDAAARRGVLLGRKGRSPRSLTPMQEAERQGTERLILSGRHGEPEIIPGGGPGSRMLWASPESVVIKGLDAKRGQWAYRGHQPSPSPAPPGSRWVTGHSEVARNYAGSLPAGEKGLGDVYFAVYDPRRIRDKGPWTRHEGLDVRNLPLVSRLLHRINTALGRSRKNFGSEVGWSPYYERVVHGGQLADAQVASYKQLPSGNFMRVRGTHPFPGAEELISKAETPKWSLWDRFWGGPVRREAKELQRRLIQLRLGGGLSASQKARADKLTPVLGHFSHVHDVPGVTRLKKPMDEVVSSARKKVLTLGLVGRRGAQTPLEGHNAYLKNLDNLFHKNKLAKLGEYAPGLPNKKKRTDPPKLTSPQTMEFVTQLHHAHKAGPHIDLRIGDTKSGIAHSWALPKVIVPQPGERVLAVQQPDHTLRYMDFRGLIGKGYGAGTVKAVDRLQTEVHHSEPGKLKFRLDRGRGDEEFILRRTGKGDQSTKWLLQNVTKTAAAMEEHVASSSEQVLATVRERVKLAAADPVIPTPRHLEMAEEIVTGDSLSQDDWGTFRQRLQRSPGYRQAVLLHPQADAKLKRHVRAMGALHEGTHLKKVQSLSGPQKYQLKLMSSGRLGCTCPDWRYRKSHGGGDCKHVRAFRSAYDAGEMPRGYKGLENALKKTSAVVSSKVIQQSLDELPRLLQSAVKNYPQQTIRSAEVVAQAPAWIRALMPQGLRRQVGSAGWTADIMTKGAPSPTELMAKRMSAQFDQRATKSLRDAYQAALMRNPNLSIPDSVRRMGF